jgi:hypothetical protein
MILLIIWVISGLLEALRIRFVYWDLSPAGLRERRLWQVRQVAWEDVTRVANWYPDYISSNYLEVHMVRNPRTSRRGSIVVNPERREEFIQVLRRFAPQARFEV